MHLSLMSARLTGEERDGANRRDHPLNPARGVAIGCLLGAGLWAGIIAAVVF